MRINYAAFLFGLLTILGILQCKNLWCQTGDTVSTIKFPLLHEDFPLYDFAEVRFESDKTEKPPADITKRKFQPAKEIFAKDELHFADSIKSFWIKFKLSNNQSSDTTIAVIFPGAVSKAVLYKSEEESLIQIGKTGFFIAVLARNVPYRWDRIDLPLKAHSKTTYFIQAILYHGISMGKMPVLENFTYAETWAFKWEKEVERPNHVWLHFFTGIFFMFFVFGFIKYLVLGKDKAYVYFSLMGLFNALLTVSMSEYPPLELSSFENVRGKELFDLLGVIGFAMQGLFILEILQLKIKYPRVTKVIQGYFFFWFLVDILRALIFFNANRGYSVLLDSLDFYNASLLLFLFVGWVAYLATIRKGFYRFIFLGALTVSTTFIFIFAIRFFDLHHVLPTWATEELRGGAQHLLQLALFIDMCFYFTGLAYRERQKERQYAELKQKETELEMQALRAQMNPHFIFNSLNSINMFILENNKLQASEYLSKFSRLVRLILQNSQEAFIPLERELEALQLYLELDHCVSTISLNIKFQWTRRSTPRC